MSDFFGLDIGSSSIKVAQIKGRSITHLGIVANPTGKVGVDLVMNEKQALAETVKKLISESGIKTKKAVVSVPEVLVYSKVMSFPVISPAELASAIKWQADQDVPLPMDQVDLSWGVIEKPNKRSGQEQMRVLVVAVPKKLSKAMTEFFSMVGVEPIRAENETVSLARLENAKTAKGSVLIGDFGANSVKMVIADFGLIRSVYSYPVGGMAFTRALGQEFSLSVIQAEQYKRAYGADRNQLEGKIFKGMEPVLNNIMEEINRMVGSFNQTNSEKRIERVIFNGGGIYLKGLIGLMTEKLGVEVVMGNPFSGYNPPPGKESEGAIYAVATGLAISES